MPGMHMHHNIYFNIFILYLFIYVNNSQYYLLFIFLSTHRRENLLAWGVTIPLPLY